MSPVIAHDMFSIQTGVGVFLIIAILCNFMHCDYALSTLAALVRILAL
jgi:hypothetical protein